MHLHSPTLILPLPPNPLRSPTEPRRPYPPKIVANVRALIENAGLSQREAAARSGVGVDTVGQWARRFGWRRANVASEAGAARGANVARGAALAGFGLARESVADNALFPHAEVPARPAKPAARSRSTHERRACVETARAAPPQHDERVGRLPGRAAARGRPYRYGPDVREAARVRVEGTRDGLERIANELGLVRSTILRWAKRSGWRRPAPPEKVGPVGTAGPMFYRSRRFGRPYGGDAVGTARDLVTGSNLPLDRVAARAGVSRATLYRWIARRGWTRQRSVTARRPRYRPPYPPAIVAAARELYQTTRLSTRMIAARAKTTRERVRHWARTNGWIRPYDLPDPHDWPAPHDGSAPHDGLARHDGSGLHGSVRRRRRSRTTGRRASAAR